MKKTTTGCWCDAAKNRGRARARSVPSLLLSTGRERSKSKQKKFLGAIDFLKCRSFFLLRLCRKGTLNLKRIVFFFCVFKCVDVEKNSVAKQREWQKKKKRNVCDGIEKCITYERDKQKMLTRDWLSDGAVRHQTATPHLFLRQINCHFFFDTQRKEVECRRSARWF